MTDIETGKYWDQNAEAWTEMARAGYDVYRDYLNTPAFFDILPEVNGLDGIDIGCGEGHNTRLLTLKGARLTAVDISETFIRRAKELNHQQIDYLVASATDLPFANDRFDFATSFMCLMDVPDSKKALQEACRVIKPGGFFQFSIAHPCFNTPHRKNLRNYLGKTYAIEVGDYFKNPEGRIEEWIFQSAPHAMKQKWPKFKIPVFNKTLATWINDIIDSGFFVERVHEPFPDDQTVVKIPAIQDAQVVSYFLHFRCRKREQDGKL